VPVLCRLNGSLMKSSRPSCTNRSAAPSACLVRPVVEGECNLQNVMNLTIERGVASSATYAEVLDAIMAGYPATMVEQQLQRLSSGDRQALLCEVCSLHNEIASNCIDHGVEVSQLLTAHCPLYLNGQATCLDKSS
jgi:hypothetical protein